MLILWLLSDEISVWMCGHESHPRPDMFLTPSSTAGTRPRGCNKVSAARGVKKHHTARHFGPSHWGGTFP
jgi:hypothetical protein